MYGTMPGVVGSAIEYTITILNIIIMTLSFELPVWVESSHVTN